MENVINEKYRGELTIALTESRYNGNAIYNLKVCSSLKDWQERFVEEIDFGYSVLGLYININDEAGKKLSEAASQLEKGKNVDLENLLK